MEDRVIPDVMKDIFLPLGRYPENFVMICQLEVCQDIIDNMDDLGRPQESYLESCMSLFIFLAEI